MVRDSRNLFIEHMRELRLHSHLYWVFSEQGLCTLTTTKTCWNCDLRLGMKGSAPGSWKQRW